MRPALEAAGASGGVLLKLLLSPLLIAQAVGVRRRALVLPEARGPRSGIAEPPPPAGASGVAPLRLLIIGDSSAAGVGVGTQEQALSGHLVRSLAAALGRPVAWRLLARSGVTSREALGLLPAALEPADLAVVVLGVNDVVGQVPVRRALAHRAALADRLAAAAGVQHVVFVALPPMHRFPLLPQPLRQVLGRDALRHDRALARWAAGRPDCSHASLPIDLSPASMAIDGFHPGEPACRACGERLAAHGKEVMSRLQVDQKSADIAPKSV